jgi:hypothetical protein
MDVKYVERELLYDADMWPPSMELAELHSRCSEPGLASATVSCPCCQQPICRTHTSWWRRNISSDFSGHSVIVSYFRILKTLIVVMLLTCLLAIYPIVQRFRVCASETCLTDIFGLLQIIAYRELFSSISPEAATALGGTTLTQFLLLQFANFVLVVIVELSIRESDEFTLYGHNSLLLKNLPSDSSEESVRTLLQEECEVTDILEVTLLYEIADFVKYQQQRNNLFFLALSYEADCVTIKEKVAAEKKLQAIDEAYQAVCRRDKNTTRAIILFNINEDRQRVSRRFHLSACQRVGIHFDKVQKKSNQVIYCSSVREPN